MAIVSVDLDVTSILHYVRIVLKTVDGRWLVRKMDAFHSRPKPGNLRTYSYLYQKGPHPLVAWASKVDRWRDECLKSGRMELDEDVIKFAELGRSLSLVRDEKGFGRVLARLKDPRQFHAAAFEIEVAASYVSKGWGVEFIEEGTTRTPDLLVTRADGDQFWVECKRRDLLTRVDTQRQAFWTWLESRILSQLGADKRNYFILVKALVEPRQEDANGLLSFILSNCTTEGFGLHHPGNPISQAQADPTGRFALVIRRLTEPDEEIRTGEIGFSTENCDRGVVAAEARTDAEGTSFFKNPVMLGFIDPDKADRVKGIRSALKTGAKQLPQAGPGVVWIRIPDNAWSEDLSGSFEAARTLLRNELKGSHNRRVNAVILITRRFERRRKYGLSGLGYRPLMLTVEHDNPRAPRR